MLTRWDRIKATQRMQAYIEARLGEPITMAQLARAARYSPWHAARVFKEITGTAPFDYIRKRPQSAAAQQQRGSGRKVVDVAIDIAICSHQGFTRAFARQFGMSPRHFRQTGAPVRLFMPSEHRGWYTERQRGGRELEQNRQRETVFVQVVDWPARKLIVRRGQKATHYFEYCEEVGCDVWEQLGAITEALNEPMGLWLPANLRTPGTSEYVQGVAVPESYSGEVPEGFDSFDLPACKMMVFQGPPFKDEDFEQAITSLWDLMKTYDPEPYGFAWADEAGPRFQLRPEGYRGYIEGRPVRAL